MGLGGWGRENATVSRINHGTRGWGKRENATVSRVNRGTRGRGGGRENATVSRVNQGLGRGKERECHSEHSNP